ncbi:collagen, type I, alpha 1a-like [Gorilla gorilla gorilla]|uniref:collagen, type I, alpha 1a-like n=1 Tax=Gorilla gorilla gorilla TaxID=9595 RepID=UPI00300BD708
MPQGSLRLMPEQKHYYAGTKSLGPPVPEAALTHCSGLNTTHDLTRKKSGCESREGRWRAGAGRGAGGAGTCSGPAPCSPVQVGLPLAVPGPVPLLVRPPPAVVDPCLAQVGLRGPTDGQTDGRTASRERPGGGRGRGGDGRGVRSRSRCSGGGGRGRDPARSGSRGAGGRQGPGGRDSESAPPGRARVRGAAVEPGGVVTPENAGSQGDREDESWRGIRRAAGALREGWSRT